MLSRENVGLASTCNVIGQTLGYSLSYIIFMAFNSPSFSNLLRSEPSDEGLVSLGWFMRMWGCVFLCMVPLVWYQREDNAEHNTHRSDANEREHGNIDSSTNDGDDDGHKADPFP